MIGLTLLSSLFALAGPSYARLPESLFESRLTLCLADNMQKRGCQAAFRYLEEITNPARRPSTAKVTQNPAAEFQRLKLRLHAQKIPESEWVAGAFNAWLNVLDSHAKLVSAEDADRRASAEKIFVQGAGAKLRFHHGKVFVGYSMEGSAAESIGLRPGDRILALNGRELGGLNETTRRFWLNKTVSPYHLRIERDGALKSLLISEKRYYLANVEGKVHRASDGKYEGILRVRSFDKDNTCSDLRSAIAAVEKENVSRLRLDLSDNPGGLVREAQCAAALFLGQGKVFARIRRIDNIEARQLIPAVPADGDVKNSEETVLLTETRSVTSLPLTVEINQNSASAAEMLAASLQDNLRAQVSGTRSFGKGSMQSVFHPWGDEKLYLTRTTHQIYRPSGATLQYLGVTPDLISRTVEGENFPRERELTL